MNVVNTFKITKQPNPSAETVVSNFIYQHIALLMVRNVKCQSLRTTIILRCINDNKRMHFE